MESSPQLPPSVKREQVYLRAIRLDDGPRVRGQIRSSVVRAYAAAMRQQQREGGLRFPPVVVFRDERHNWLGDGFHRVTAAGHAGLSEFPADVYAGTRRDALLFAVAANAGNGLPRSHADKRQAVGVLLADPEWGRWSDREIARRCHVSDRLVNRLRHGASANESQMRPRKVRRGGTIYEMRTPPPRPLPGAWVEAATIDRVGLPVPARVRGAFDSSTDFWAAKDAFVGLCRRLDSLAKRRAGEAYRYQLRREATARGEAFTCPHLETAYGLLLAAEPYCAYCPACELAHPGRSNPECQTCRGRGWTTQAEFEACPVEQRELVRLRNDGQGLDPTLAHADDKVDAGPRVPVS